MAKLKLPGDLMKRAEVAAETAGYSSVTEFITHLLEKELTKVEKAVSDSTDAEELKERLKGLGYIS